MADTARSRLAMDSSVASGAGASGSPTIRTNDVRSTQPASAQPRATAASLRQSGGIWPIAANTAPARAECTSTAAGTAMGKPPLASQSATVAAMSMPDHRGSAMA